MTNLECQIAGCARPRLARGWCQRHYQRWLRKGTTDGRDLTDCPAIGTSTHPCSGCGGPKPLGRGLIFCGTCKERHHKEREEREALRQREKALMKTYGITVARYDQMLADQDGVCAICRRGPTQRYRYLDVDHDHETGAVRGLLCRRCNVGLSYIESSFHAPALDYLRGVRYHGES